MASIILKVKPDELKRKSSDIKNEIASIESEFEEIEKVVTGTKKYWEGEASNYHIQSYNKMKEDISIIIRKLKEHPKDLEKMAGVYEQTEETIKQVSTALPVDVLS